MTTTPTATDDTVVDPYARLLAEQFPDYADWQVEMIAREIEELDGAADDISRRAQQLHSLEGFFLDAAIEQAIEQATVASSAPDGYLFVRITKADCRPTMVLLRL